ncbi:hypothetical protein TNCV_1445141 [Trichonephila clavipes]|nr:hypothetical protein TNCV_1445141 [Trichonephila clavipes]
MLVGVFRTNEIIGMMQQFKTGLSNSRVERICKQGESCGTSNFCSTPWYRRPLMEHVTGTRSDVPKKNGPMRYVALYPHHTVTFGDCRDRAVGHYVEETDGKRDVWACPEQAAPRNGGYYVGSSAL